MLRKHLVRLLRMVRQSIRYHKVRVTLAVWLQPAMPAGVISRSSSLHEVLEVVAESFGGTVVCFDGMQPARVYTGPWDGKPPRWTGANAGSHCYVAGTFYRDFSSCELVWVFNFSRYLTWYRRNLASRVTQILAMTPEAMIGVQQKVLEQTLGEDWLRSRIERGSKHPACERWTVCETFRQRKGIVRVPSQLTLAYAVLETIADNATLVQCTAGHRHRFSVGSLANYGDPAVLKRLKKVLLHDTQFGDALLELSCAAWHRNKGRDVIATEAEGMPDLRVTIPGWVVPVFADCKRVTAKSAKAIETVIAKANQQFGNAGIIDGAQAGFGVVYMDVTARVGFPERGKEGAVPAEVQKVADLVLRRLYRHNRSVCAVVLLWRERIAATDSQSPPSISLFLILRGLVIRHRQPRVELPVDDEAIRVEGTYMLKVVP